MRRVLVIQHNEAEGLAGLEAPLREGGVVLEPWLAPQRLPESMADYHGLIVMGGAMGAYEGDRHPYLRAELRLIRGALANDIPTLGVCLGSQLIAAAADARVFRGPKPELGWHRVIRVAGDPWLPDWPAEFDALHWHGDTFDLPAGATHLAASDAYRNQAFRLGSALALQFHVEATPHVVRAWIHDESPGDALMLPAGTLEKSESAVQRLAPLVSSLARAFAAAVLAHR